MDQLDINPRILASVKKARIVDYGTLLSYSTPDLQRLTQLSVSDVCQLQQAAAQKVHRIPNTTALQLHNGTGPSKLQRCTLTTGCQVLDAFLRGGILSRTLMEVAGESASGKTQLCMQLCLTVQLPQALGGLSGGAVYICTEDVFPNKRLQQMVALLKRRCEDPKVKDINFTDNIFIEHAAELDDLWYCLSKKLPVLLAQGRVKLIVVDSIAALFRCEHDTRSMQSRAKLMRKMASQLLHLANTYNIPTICVNQVTDVIKDRHSSGPSQRKVTPALGISWANLVTIRIMLMRTPHTVTLPQKDLHGVVIGHQESPVRTMEVLFAPHLPSSMCRYIVDQDGVKGLPSAT